jgi:hypothetical protein
VISEHSASSFAFSCVLNMSHHRHARQRLRHSAKIGVAELSHLAASSPESRTQTSPPRAIPSVLTPAWEIRCGLTHRPFVSVSAESASRDALRLPPAQLGCHLSRDIARLAIATLNETTGPGWSIAVEQILDEVFDVRGLDVGLAVDQAELTRSLTTVQTSRSLPGTIDGVQVELRITKYRFQTRLP